MELSRVPGSQARAACIVALLSNESIDGTKRKDESSDLRLSRKNAVAGRVSDKIYGQTSNRGGWTLKKRRGFVDLRG